MSQYRIIIEGSVDHEGPDWVDPQCIGDLARLFLGQLNATDDPHDIKFVECRLERVDACARKAA
jgi:hypothetical protein